MKKKRKKSLAKRMMILLLLLVGLGALGAGSAYYYVTTASQPVSAANRDKVEVEISKGMSFSQATRQLKKAGLIKDELAFKLLAKINHLTHLQAGYYQLSPSQSAQAILQVLNEGGSSSSIHDQKIIVREGELYWDVIKQIAQISQQSEEKVDALIEDWSFLAQLVARYPRLFADQPTDTKLNHTLEGYLYPATYYFKAKTQPREIIETMVSRMDEALSDSYDEIDASPLNVHETLTLASLLEKEGVSPADRQKIAGVFMNRLAQDMPLQTDISVLYALGEHKEMVSYKDLEVDSPYNLYQHRGLGPGPFNNPSSAAIQAAIHPTSTDALYFLADVKTGKVYYATTYEAHLSLKKKYVD